MMAYNHHKRYLIKTFQMIFINYRNIETTCRVPLFFCWHEVHLCCNIYRTFFRCFPRDGGEEEAPQVKFISFRRDGNVDR